MSAEAAAPKVSVVIPFTERGELLDRAIRSVEAALAAAPEVAGELIPVDDSARRGVSWARNEGLCRARGKWVVFVDADDELGENFFAEIFASHEDETVDLIVCGYEVVREDGQKLPPAAQGADGLLTGYGFIEHRVLRQDAHVWGKAFRRAAVGGGETEDGDALPALFFDGELTIGEDMLFLVDFALRAGKRRCIAVTQKPGYRYHINPAGAMERPYEPSWLDELRCWRLAQERILPFAGALSPYACSALGTIRIRTALMVPLKIAQLPKEKWEEPEIREALLLTAEAVREALGQNGAFAGLGFKEKAKTLLFLRFPGKFLRLAKKN